MAMFSPPIPAMAMVSPSSGPMAERPEQSRGRIFPSTPQRRAVSSARERGPGRKSLAIASSIRPFWMSQAGR